MPIAMSKYWFEPKDQGYGNVPITWQGWAVTIAFSACIVAIVVALYVGMLSALAGVVIALAVTAIYLPFIRAKTSAEWRWRKRV